MYYDVDFTYKFLMKYHEIRKFSFSLSYIFK